PLIQFASLTGISGVSLWVIFLNILVYFLFKHRKNLPKASGFAILIVLLFLVPYLYGKKALSEASSSSKIKVALIQGNIDMNVKWNPKYLNYSFEVFTSLSKKAVEENPDLIIWPETSAPCYLAYEPYYFNWVQSLSDSLNKSIVVGTDDYKIVGDNQYIFYNAVFLFQPNKGLADRYYKMQLVPFAEKLPLSGKMRVLNKIQLGQANFSSGENYTLFDSPKGKFASLVCFEMAFPNLVRKFVNKGASFLVNITNDSWFGRTAGPHQHAAMSIVRAIENRISIARCANSGISILVDPYGRIIEKTGLFEQLNLVGEIPLKNKESFFSRHGNFVTIISLAFSLGFLILAILKK
ncbi:MAG: apolipoprotein N-acyltransferase, partial [candidate division Zixibacteria bacterium RBG_16_40_9]